MKKYTLLVPITSNTNGCTQYPVDTIKEAKEILKKLKAEGKDFPFGQLVAKDGKRKDVFI
jgi:hypothetical protein